MSNYKLKNDEAILFEGKVIFENIKPEVKFTLTNKKLIFEKEKGIFKKKLKAFDIIPLENIKIYKDKVLAKNEDLSVTIQTIDKNITFDCSNTSDAKEIVKEIKRLKTSGNKFKKIINAINETKDFVVAVGGMASSINETVGEIASSINETADNTKK